MYRNKLFLGILTLACFIILTPSLATAQSDKVKSAMADLKAMAGTLGVQSSKAAIFISVATKRTTQ
jgi:hypothetical protein